MRRNQHRAACQPSARIHYQITDRPVLIVKIEILYLADFTIRRTEFISV